MTIVNLVAKGQREGTSDGGRLCAALGGARAPCVARASILRAPELTEATTGSARYRRFGCYCTLSRSCPTTLQRPSVPSVPAIHPSVVYLPQLLIARLASVDLVLDGLQPLQRGLEVAQSSVA